MKKWLLTVLLALSVLTSAMGLKALTTHSAVANSPAPVPRIVAVANSPAPVPRITAPSNSPAPVPR